MKRLSTARDEDAADRPVSAIEAYEEALASEDVELDAYLDLAVLYLECCDFGFAAHYKVPPELEASAYDKALEVLDRAELRFGRHSEITFWRHYLRMAVLGDALEADEVLKLVREDESLVPFLLLVGTPAASEHARRLEALLNQVGEGRTARQRLVKGILERHSTINSRKQGSPD